MKKAVILVLALVLPLIATLISCTNTKKKTLTIAGNIKIDRSSTENGVNFFFTPLEDFISTPLLTIAADFQPRPILLKEARPLDGGKVWDIEIKENVRFHDGTMLTADDVAFSIEKRREIYQLLRSIRQTEVVDNKTVRLTLEAAQPDINDILNTIYVYPRHIFRPDIPWKETFLKNPIGSGPFRFKRWLRNGVELAANKDYFEGRPKIDRVVYISENNERSRLNMLLKGEADAITSVNPETATFIDKDPKFYVNRLPLPFYMALFLNNRSPIFVDRAVRKAVDMAIDREFIIKKAIGGAGVVASTPFMKNMLPDDYTVSPPTYDPKEAVRLLKEAGWRDSDNDGVLKKNGRRLRFTLYYSAAGAECKKIADAIFQQLYEAGFEVDARQLEYTELGEDKIASLKYDALLGSLAPFSPEYKWGSRDLHGPEIRNYSDYSNKEVDALFEKTISIKDPEEIKRIYARIDRIIREDAPAAILYSPVFFTASNRRFKDAEAFDGTPYAIYKIKEWE